MKRSMSFAALVLIAAALIFSACSRSITPYEAANGKARCGRSVR